MRYFIEIAYDGKLYHGWQKQPNAMTIQEEVEACFAKIFQEEIKLTGAGRTDTGVHARHLVAHFDREQVFDRQHLIYKLNRMLSSAIVVHRIYEVHSEAHARFDAVKRTYKYYISTKKDPFTHDYAWFVPGDLNIELMNEACEILKSHHDFQCFSKVKTDVYTYNCEIYEAGWLKKNNHFLFTIVADRFLRNMVRAIVGTLVEIGQGKKTLSDLEQTLASKNRSKAGKSVPAKGLFLHKISYPDTVKLN